MQYASRVQLENTLLKELISASPVLRVVSSPNAHKHSKLSSKTIEFVFFVSSAIVEKFPQSSSAESVVTARSVPRRILSNVTFVPTKPHLKKVPVSAKVVRLDEVITNSTGFARHANSSTSMMEASTFVIGAQTALGGTQKSVPQSASHVQLALVASMAVARNVSPEKTLELRAPSFVPPTTLHVRPTSSVVPKDHVCVVKDLSVITRAKRGVILAERMSLAREVSTRSARSARQVRKPLISRRFSTKIPKGEGVFAN